MWRWRLDSGVSRSATTQNATLNHNINTGSSRLKKLPSSLKQNSDCWSAVMNNALTRIRHQSIVIKDEAKEAKLTSNSLKPNMQCTHHSYWAWPRWTFEKKKVGWFLKRNQLRKSLKKDCAWLIPPGIKIHENLTDIFNVPIRVVHTRKPTNHIPISGTSRNMKYGSLV